MSVADRVELTFAALVAAAIAGERCPITRREGVPNGVDPDVMCLLRKMGRIKVEVYAHNWRVVEILTGPAAGKRTAPPPNSNWQPYLILDKDGPQPMRARARVGA